MAICDQSIGALYAHGLFVIVDEAFGSIHGKGVFDEFP